jgi:hypothetical protein
MVNFGQEMNRNKSDNQAVMEGLLGGFAKLRKTIISFKSVWPFALNNSVPTERIFMKLDIWEFFQNVSRKSKFD